MNYKLKLGLMLCSDSDNGDCLHTTSYIDSFSIEEKELIITQIHSERNKETSAYTIGLLSITINNDGSFTFKCHSKNKYFIITQEFI